MNIMDINLEKVSESQIFELCEFAKEIWTEHYLPIIGQKQIDYMLDKFQSERAVKNQINDGYLYYFIKADSEKCGYIALHPENDSLFLSKFYIHKSFRGNGIGKRTFDFVKDLAGQFNLSKIKLTVNKYNSDSVSIYEKLGMKNVDSVVSDIGNGFVMDDYIFEYSLG